MKNRIAIAFPAVLLLLTARVAAEPRPALEKRAAEMEGIAAEIVPLLSEAPDSLGIPAGDRAAWDKVAAADYGKRILAQAEKALQSDVTPLPDSLFLEYSRNGKRGSWEDAFGRNRERLKYLVLAECLENRGRFLPALDTVIGLFCSLKTLVKPAHDAKLDNFSGRRIEIDLESSSLAFELALVLRLLPGKLPAATGALILKNIESRVLTPYRDMVYGRVKENFWMRAEHNWNAVCHAGVAGAALALPLSRFERASFIAAAEQYLPQYIKGFTEDGYCVEGVGYWNYGFGHYVLLSEAILRASGGRIDFLAGFGRPDPAMTEKIRKIAEYGFDIELAPGVSPAFADADPASAPEQRLQKFLKRRLGIGRGIHSREKNDALSGPLQLVLLYLFPNSADRAAAASAGERNDPFPLRSYFQDAGVLLLRTSETGADGLAVAVKAGSNSGNHSHNDTGSFMVAVDGDPVLVDPGAEVYSARTFSSRRYESRLINSWGHPVPVAAGRLQETGPQAAAGNVRHSSVKDTDGFWMDLTACYQVAGLKSLVRGFFFTRPRHQAPPAADTVYDMRMKREGDLAVTDLVEFEKPEAFETALVTFGSVKIISDSDLLVFGRRGALAIRVFAGDAAFTLKAEPIDEETRSGQKPTRIGITLKAPVTSAMVSVIITCYRPENEGLLRNGGFEFDAWGWDLGRNGMGRIERGRASSGEQALLIKDESTTDGSNVLSAPVRAEAGTAYVLSGKVFLADGADCGVYVKFFDRDGRPLGTGEDQINVAPKAAAAARRGKYSDWRFEFTTPAECAELAVWVHSYNAARVTLSLDEIKLEKKSD